MATNKYWNPSTASSISESELTEADAETQKEVMRDWFLSHFEDPAENTPWEGQYIYIWGGPYNAEEELSEEFGDIVPEEVIEELGSDLASLSFEWVKKSEPHTLDDYEFGIISSNTRFHETFRSDIAAIEGLRTSYVNDRFKRNYHMMLYVSVITAMETYLSDAFINLVLNDKQLLRRFVETNPEFKKQSVSLGEIFLRMDKIESDVKDYLLETIWHRLDKVKPMYQSTLQVDFPNDMSAIFRAIATRHDIVHRNGKDKDGTKLEITDQEVGVLIERIRAFIDDIDEQLGQFELPDFNPQINYDESDIPF
jgi:hypothetical protein